MKSRFLLSTLLCFTGNAQAAPYFRLLDPAHIHKIIGVSIDPVNTGQSSLVTEIALITHSTRDGCLFPAIVCEDWSPLMIGPSYHAGRFAVVFGPVVNLSAVAKIGLLKAVNLLTGEGEWPDLKGFLAPASDGLTTSFGPQLQINPMNHGRMMPLNRWAPAGRIFAGAALKF